MATAEHTLKSPAAGTAPAAAAEPPARSIGSEASRRVLRFVAIFRVAVGIVMLVIAFGFRNPQLLGIRDTALFLVTATGYCLFAVLLLVWQWRRPVIMPRLVLIELLIDVLAISLLMHASGGVRSGLGVLMVVFVGAASLSLQGRQAFFASAVAALAILAEQGLRVLEHGAPSGDFVAAGVLGAIIFMIASAAYPLARRLEESEALARQRGIDLANLAQLNDYIIQNLRESIVVVDAANRVRLINQSAAEHTGIRTREPGQDLAQLAPHLHRMLRDWRRQGNPLLQPPSFLSADGSTRINAYLAPLGGGDDGPVLMFLEDAGLLSQKVQQSKLAALGRLSASIAHEIRNPVGALSHASQLLEESPRLGADDRRLIDIIRTNSRRVNEIIENVLQLSRRETSRPELIYLAGWTRDFAAEFSSTLELHEGQLGITSTEDVEVRVDPSHLRQVVWNLCENAIKYGSSNGGIAVEIGFGRLPGSRRPYLEVSDCGAGIPDEMREQIFEPFATGRSGGTGLGLFISRELCECNRAALVYEARRGGGSVFRIVFADPARWEN
ncbi:MAG: PAS domain-containing protein [Gammaproteobacteria bacterium]|nr:PAS domain-containing protein [Gammaproteobacteria bacterium]